MTFVLLLEWACLLWSTLNHCSMWFGHHQPSAVCSSVLIEMVASALQGHAPAAGGAEGDGGGAGPGAPRLPGCPRRHQLLLLLPLVCLCDLLQCPILSPVRVVACPAVDNLFLAAAAVLCLIADVATTAIALTLDCLQIRLLIFFKREFAFDEVRSLPLHVGIENPLEGCEQGGTGFVVTLSSYTSLDAIK